MQRLHGGVLELGFVHESAERGADDLFGRAEQPPRRTVAGQGGEVLVEQDEPFIHAAGDGVEFHLLAPQLGHLAADLAILRVQPVQKRAQLIVDPGGQRRGRVNRVDGPDEALSQLAREQGGKQKYQPDHDGQRGNRFNHRAHDEVGRVCHAQHGAVRHAQRVVTGQGAEGRGDAQAFARTGCQRILHLGAGGMVFHGGRIDV